MRLRRRRDIWDVAVIGGGITGLTAAWHAVRRGLTTVLFEGAAAHGGQVANVNHLEDWPSGDASSGVELAAGLVAKLRDENVELCNEPVSRVAVEGKLVRLEAGRHTMRARSALIASGAQLKRLGVPGEEALVGKGVSQCADCDGYFFRDQDVVVVGGGDGALHEALVLSGMCRSVTIVVRSKVRARAAYVERASGAANVRFVFGRVVQSVLGNGAVSGVRLVDVNTGAVEELACAGVFPFIGSSPDTAFIGAGVERDAEGCLVTDGRMRTNIPLLYAAGAVRSGYGGDLVAAAGEGAAAVRWMASSLTL